jgi:hypothetical protein
VWAGRRAALQIGAEGVVASDVLARVPAALASGGE